MDLFDLHIAPCLLPLVFGATCSSSISTEGQGSFADLQSNKTTGVRETCRTRGKLDPHLMHSSARN